MRKIAHVSYVDLLFPRGPAPLPNLYLLSSAKVSVHPGFYPSIALRIASSNSLTSIGSTSSTWDSLRIVANEGLHCPASTALIDFSDTWAALANPRIE